MKERKLKRATSLAAIHQSCKPRPLRREELAEFFVPTAEARDEIVSRRESLRKILTRDPHGQSKLLLAGHAGSGKSTELVKLIDELGDGFFVVDFSVVQECNLIHLAVEDLLVVMMERLVHACQEANMEGSFAGSGALEEIYHWFTRNTEIVQENREMGMELEAGVDASQSYFGKLVGLLAKWKSAIRHKTERYTRSELVKPHRLSELTERCNSLIRDVQLALGERSLLVIIEDADKINLADARRIFIEQPRALADLATNLICTVPIFLLYTPDRIETLEPLFQVMVLPMPKVFEFDGLPCEKGRTVIRKIISRRMDEQLIDEEALTWLIEMTGGVLRDVFEVLIVAAEAAESMHERGRQPEGKINTQNIRYGLNRRKSEYARSISTIHLPSEWSLTHEQLYERLRELAKRPRRHLQSDHCAMVLLQAKAVIEYNGEQWFDVHPLVKELLLLEGKGHAGN
jgi:hypothetical protein